MPHIQLCFSHRLSITINAKNIMEEYRVTWTYFLLQSRLKKHEHVAFEYLFKFNIQ